jgi:pSer/pThr/pTyr-binding forkhead associated (FHA) protein
MSGRARTAQPPPGATRLDACALLRGAEAGAAEAGPHLLVEEPGAAPRVVALTADCTVGRGAAAALRLSDPSASRLHLRLRIDATGAFAEDLGSRNGLCVNGGPARGARRLRSGDELEAGATRLRFVDPLEPAWPATVLRPARRPPADWPLPAAAILLLAAALALLLP